MLTPQIKCNRFTQRTVIPLTRASSMLNQEACSSLELKTRIGVLVDVDIKRVTRDWNCQSKYRIERVDSFIHEKKIKGTKYSVTGVEK